MNTRKIFTIGKSLTLCSVLTLMTMPQQSNAWTPGAGEESELFNQLVREQLKFIPQTPIKDWRGRTVGWRGPTYEQQLGWEYKRQLNLANNAEKERNTTMAASNKQMDKLKSSLENEKNNTDKATKRAEAQRRVNLAQSLQPNGPTSREVTARLGDSRNAGGRLDADRDGVISEAEMKSALAGRVSMQRTQYLDEKKLDVDGNNEIGKSETTKGLVDTSGKTVLDHNQMLSEARTNSNFKETGIGKGTFIDASGNVKNISSLTPASLNSQLTQYTAQRDAAKYSRDNNQMTPTKLRNGQLPTTTHRHASITTSGTWGKTRSWNGSWNAGAGISNNTRSIQTQMNNPQAAGANNKFYNQTQASTAGFQNGKTSAQNKVANAQRLQNSTTGFRNAQQQVQGAYNSMNK